MTKCINKWLLLASAALIWMDGNAQTKKSVTSKRATVVDSLSAPPRMDGNTGKYDTVRNPMMHSGKSDTKTNYNYKLQSDTIGVQRTKAKQP